MRVLDFFSEQKVQVEQEHASLATFLDNLAKVPHVEGVLQDHLAEAVCGYITPLQQRQMHSVVGLLRHRQHNLEAVLADKKTTFTSDTI